jgi:hypothetical protein
MISASDVRPAFRSRPARADRSAATATNAAATSSGAAVTMASPTPVSATIRSMPAAVPADREIGPAAPPRRPAHLA